MPDDDRERPRKSWREIDAQRDRSSQTTPRGREDKPRPGQRSQKSYRAALDRLFESGGVGKLLEGAAAKPAPPDEATETRAKLAAKGCDLVVANQVGGPEGGFATDDNRVTLVTADGLAELEGSKDRLADAILDRIVPVLDARRPRG